MRNPLAYVGVTWRDVLELVSCDGSQSLPAVITAPAASHALLPPDLGGVLQGRREALPDRPHEGEATDPRTRCTAPVHSLETVRDLIGEIQNTNASQHKAAGGMQIE
ncbi:hypothetical protein NDU88_001603 [Pleurodeles waltl]|uniref:Uncharacterized protein n=1 Tax=Pleurodeles waltl TaxID=8319 RepID=A0AAV7RAF0_PLEWA|nr:hypothetical protein NDU88_001603 [Pleurodeles waltl]